MRDMFKTISWLFVLILSACGGNSLGTAVGNPPTNGGKAVMAVAALFSTDSSANLSALIKKQVVSQQADPVCEGTPAECMCAEVEAGVGGPSQVEDGLFGVPGTYGAVTQSITVGEEDFCQLPDGTDNPTAGQDGKGRFATFELTADITATCLDNSVQTELVMQSGSSGIWRNTDADDDNPAYFPQIFGVFNFESDGESFELNCAIFLDENGNALLADCSDDSGNSITQDEGVECNFPSD